ncbi:MAG: hypothetical protein ABSC21_23755 [Terriglobia bacterium]
MRGTSILPREQHALQKASTLQTFSSYTILEHRLRQRRRARPSQLERNTPSDRDRKRHRSLEQLSHRINHLRLLAPMTVPLPGATDAGIPHRGIEQLALLTQRRSSHTLATAPEPVARSIRDPDDRARLNALASSMRH